MTRTEYLERLQAVRMGFMQQAAVDCMPISWEQADEQARHYMTLQPGCPQWIVSDKTNRK
jgi:hypothetical protein